MICAILFAFVIGVLVVTSTSDSELFPSCMHPDDATDEGWKTQWKDAVRKIEWNWQFTIDGIRTNGVPTGRYAVYKREGGNLTRIGRDGTYVTRVEKGGKIQIRDFKFSETYIVLGKTTDKIDGGYIKSAEKSYMPVAIVAIIIIAAVLILCCACCGCLYSCNRRRGSTSPCATPQMLAQPVFNGTNRPYRLESA